MFLMRIFKDNVEINKTVLEMKRSNSSQIRIHSNKGANPNLPPLTSFLSECGDASPLAVATEDSFTVGSGDCVEFSVLYGKVSGRKHKKWEGDGFLVCKLRTAALLDEDRKVIAKMSAFPKKRLDELEEGSRIVIGGFEVEIQEKNQLTEDREYVAISENQTCSPVSQCISAVHSTFSAPSNQSFKPPFKNSIAECANVLNERNGDRIPTEFVVNETQVAEACAKPIALRGIIASSLRPHQKDGVAFLYSKLEKAQSGAILADEMGLGKTVQTISLIWALLKSHTDRPLIRNCLLVVPSSLLGNWQYEFKKWLPNSRSLLFQVNKVCELNSYWASLRCSPVAIMSYEMMSRCFNSLMYRTFDLLVCDEAHRLKNRNGRMRQQIASLNANRRLLLTGTPIQNDLNEFFSLLDLARPEYFGSYSEFSRRYQDCVEHGELLQLVSDVMLRRTSEVNSEWLPPKNDYIFWCRPSELQTQAYNRMLDLFGESDHLLLIDCLKKLCNHPAVLYRSALQHVEDNSPRKDFYADILRCFGEAFNRRPLSLSDSGKLSVFMELISAFVESHDKVLVVSNFTKTLDMLQGLCHSLDICFSRIDGTTKLQRRMEIVDDFNSLTSNVTVLLLSAKAGGVGFNLIGANRLIMYDFDWNPAVDMQAMARIWRQGQTKYCHIYRLLTTGTIDEKIFQRQVKKSGLSNVIDFGTAFDEVVTFSPADLKDIFTFDSQSDCNTHDLIECPCKCDGVFPFDVVDVDEEADIDDQSATCLEENKSSSNPVLSGAAPLMDSNEDNDFLQNAEELIKTTCRQESEILPASISMGALMRWNHYSPRETIEFERLKKEIGLEKYPLAGITFLMKLTSNY